ncbi:MAG: hypothetical protein JO110_08760, partial [Acetobacteraceae bacterium]|nr:hypothetical protein [Acetobacteraceae bacterium]
MLAAHMVQDRSAVPLMFLARARLGRLVSRFEALVAAVRAGRVPTRPASRLQDAASLNLPWLERLPQPYRLPRKLGWLIPLVPGTAAYAGQVQHLLADPEMAALLAGSPQAGHILRPLCRMLGIQPEPGLLAERREPPRRGVRPRRGAPPRGVPRLACRWGRPRCGVNCAITHIGPHRAPRFRESPKTRILICPDAGRADREESMSATWPEIPYEPWRDTCSALHLYLQIAGKY